MGEVTVSLFRRFDVDGTVLAVEDLRVRVHRPQLNNGEWPTVAIRQDQWPLRG